MSYVFALTHWWSDTDAAEKHVKLNKDLSQKKALKFDNALEMR